VPRRQLTEVIDATVERAKAATALVINLGFGRSQTQKKSSGSREPLLG